MFWCFSWNSFIHFLLPAASSSSAGAYLSGHQVQGICTRHRKLRIGLLRLLHLILCKCHVTDEPTVLCFWDVLQVVTVADHMTREQDLLSYNRKAKKEIWTGCCRFLPSCTKVNPLIPRIQNLALLTSFTGMQKLCFSHWRTYFRKICEEMEH